MSLIDGRELGARWSDEQIRTAVDRRLRWRASSGLDTPDNPYWDAENEMYLLEEYQDDKSCLADAYLDTLHGEQPRSEGGEG